MISLGIIGGGNMGEAIIARARGKYKILVCEASSQRARVLKTKYKILPVDLNALVDQSQIIVLAVKPQDMGLVLDQIAGKNLQKKIIVSIAAGITVSFIQQQLLQKARVIRTMPNMPALIGEGITAVCKGQWAQAGDVKLVCRLFDLIGETVVVEESLMDTITAVSGSGPAYVFLIVESLINSALALGLSAPQAKKFVYKTLSGSVHLLEKSLDDAATLRAKVTSRGGTTQAAMDVFIKRDLEKIFIQALTAACHRAKTLSM